MHMPMIRIKPDGSSELYIVDLNDVIYIKVENRSLVFHTADEQYHQISTLSDLEEHLYPFGFDLLDKTNLVNMKKIKKMDSKHGNIYFDEYPTRDSKFASVAFIKQKLFKDEIATAIQKNTNRSSDEAGMKSPNGEPSKKAHSSKKDKDLNL